VFHNTGNVTSNFTLRRVSVTTVVGVEKQQVLRCSECVFLALVIQDATRMRRTILLSVSCLALPYLA
jgi:hypothetical protein